MKNIIALAFRTGGDYDHRHVNNIVEQIRRNTTQDIEIVCFTDNPTGIVDVDRIIKLEYDWPSWWCKIEMFRPGVFQSTDNVTYFDLDTFVIGNIDSFINMHDNFVALQDLSCNENMASGLMSWVGGAMDEVYRKFLTNPERMMLVYSVVGDQGFISDYGPRLVLLQNRLPANYIMSYKLNCHFGKTPPSWLTSIICFHGKPRPHEITGPLSEYWQQ